MSLNKDISSIKVLLLAGGKSSRLGQPKHLLQTPSDETLYQRQLRLLQSCLPDSTIHISLAQETEMDKYLSELPVLKQGGADISIETPIGILLDEDVNRTQESKGPASGLLAAHAYDPEAVWLVIACDYALLPGEALVALLREPEASVVCYRNTEGFCEPLLGLWRPEALQILARRALEGRLSPSSVVRDVGGLMLDAPPGCAWWFDNVNTPEDWERIKDRLGKAHKGESGTDFSGLVQIIPKDLRLE